MEYGSREFLMQAHLYRSLQLAQPKSVWQITLAHPPSIQPGPVALSGLSPSASVRPAQKNYRDGLPASDGATPPRCLPATPRSPLAASRIAALHRRRLPAPAMPSDSTSRSASAVATPTARTPPAPCTPATSPLHALSAPGLPHCFARSLCSTPPAACPPAYLHGPAPLLPAPPHVRVAAPRSLPTRCGTLASLPENRSAPETRCCRPPATAPGLPSGTSAHPLLPYTGPAQNVLPPALDGSGSPALRQHRRYTVPP